VSQALFFVECTPKSAFASSHAPQLDLLGMKNGCLDAQIGSALWPTQLSKHSQDMRSGVTPESEVFPGPGLGATKIENVLSATTQREVVREGEIPIALSGKAGGHLPLSLASSFSYHQKKTQRWQGCRSTHIVNSLYSCTVPSPSSGGARLLGLRHRTDIDVCNEGRGCSLSSLTPTHFHLL
jgi:hypothetical protein